MSLAILSNSLQPQENVLPRIISAVLKAGLFCGLKENALKSNGKIEDIEIRKYFGSADKDYEYFLMDVHEMDWSVNSYSHGTFKRNGQVFYLLAGTDNAPSHLCYIFSLQYLRLFPQHSISIYDTIFAFDEIEQIEQATGYVEDWLSRIK